jgi:hypothetical protein
MIIKYKETSTIIKKVNDKIINHADIFDHSEQLKIQKK